MLATLLHHNYRNLYKKTDSDAIWYNLCSCAKTSTNRIRFSEEITTFVVNAITGVFF